MLLLNTTLPIAFITLANLLNRPIPSAYLNAGPSSATDPIHTLILSTLAIKRPSLHSHLTSQTLNLQSSEYLDPILSTLFCSSKFSLDISSRIIDVYVFEGDKTLVRAAVATLAALEGKLYGSKDEILSVTGGEGMWELGPEEEFLNLVREMGKVEGESPK